MPTTLSGGDGWPPFSGRDGETNLGNVSNIRPSDDQPGDDHPSDDPLSDNPSAVTRARTMAVPMTDTPDRIPTGSPSQRPTMRDVAARAGVGLSTVSRVVSGDVKVSPARMLAVQKAIAELGFRRNDSARQLRKGAAESIGLLIENVADPFFSLLNHAVEEVALSRDSLLMSASSHQDAERAKKLTLALCARRVDGLIITPSEPQEIDYLQFERDAGIHLVFVDRPVPGLDADTVLTDNAGGARSGVEHLLAQGHRRIACFTDRAELFTSAARLEGYRSALTSAGIPLDPSLVHSARGGDASVQGPLGRMLASPEPPTAIFTANNRATIMILRELAVRRERLAMVGFDDFELADVLDPAVTVVAQDPLSMGRIAANLLFARLDGERGPSQTVTLRTSLIVRGSGEIAASRAGVATS